MVYQPVVGMAERRILGLEALVRWDHPLLGTVPPDEFISLAEDDGLIVPCSGGCSGRRRPTPPRCCAAGWDLQMGVNVSVRHLQAGCLAPDVAHRAGRVRACRRASWSSRSPSRCMLDAEDRLESDLATLHGMGCVLSVDDFGRGYSSLAYLARLPVDVLKMDREFIADIERDERGRRARVRRHRPGAHASAWTSSPRASRPSVSCAILRDMRCRYLQGWLFGRPMPPGRADASVLDGFDPALLDGDPVVKWTRVSI